MKLSRTFYTRPTLDVTQDLLGKYLVFSNISGKICETEAYIGKKDKASHASKGKTKRNEAMYNMGGFTYIYMIYGMYYCLNIVTEKKGFPAAVLIRAIELPNANGPGKLCKKLDINKTHNGIDVTGEPIYIEDRHEKISYQNIIRTPRIGVNYAGDDANLPWRFCIKNSKYLSGKNK